MEFFDLSDFFTTKTEADNFSARIALISEKVFEIDFNLEKAVQEQFGMQKKDSFIAFLRKNNIPLDSNSTLNKFLEKVQKYTSTLPTAYLNIAIQPQEEILKAVSDWFILNLKRQVLIDIRIEPGLIAGATVSFQGKQFDASVRTTFDKICTQILDNKTLEKN